jgi:hypothetical protein
MGLAVSVTMMADSLHSHNSNPRNRVKASPLVAGRSRKRECSTCTLRARESNYRVEFRGTTRGPRKRLRLTQLVRF